MYLNFNSKYVVSKSITNFFKSSNLIISSVPDWKINSILQNNTEYVYQRFLCRPNIFLLGMSVGEIDGLQLGTELEA